MPRKNAPDVPLPLFFARLDALFLRVQRALQALDAPAAIRAYATDCAAEIAEALRHPAPILATAELTERYHAQWARLCADAERLCTQPSTIAEWHAVLHWLRDLPWRATTATMAPAAPASTLTARFRPPCPAMGHDSGPRDALAPLRLPTRSRRLEDVPRPSDPNAPPRSVETHV